LRSQGLARRLLDHVDRNCSLATTAGKADKPPHKLAKDCVMVERLPPHAFIIALMIGVGALWLVTSQIVSIFIP